MTELGNTVPMRRWVHVLVSAMVCLSSMTMAAPAQSDLGWTTFRSEGFDLTFEYPARVFPTVEEDPTAALGPRIKDRAGRTFTSGDGQATLQVGAFQNVDGLNVAALRARALKSSYDGAKIDYDRTAPAWFVLSGLRADEMFYERVSLSCGGKRIDVWQMSYPAAQRSFYDRVVEEMARKYRPALSKIKC